MWHHRELLAAIDGTGFSNSLRTRASAMCAMRSPPSVLVLRGSGVQSTNIDIYNNYGTRYYIPRGTSCTSNPVNSRCNTVAQYDTSAVYMNTVLYCVDSFRIMQH